MASSSNFSLETIGALKNIASDSFKRSHLIQDQACIGGLVLVLSNSDENVVKEALATFLLLSDTRERKQVLKKAIGLLASLESIITNRQQGRELVRHAEQLYDLLTEDDPVPLRDASNTSDTSAPSGGTHKARSSKYFFGTTPNKTKLIHLQIRGLLDTADKELCRDLLVRVKGVISITFDTARKRCICRTKKEVQPGKLAAAIARSQTMRADQLVRDESGKEIAVPLDDSANPVPDLMGLPDYLPPDTDSPERSGQPVARLGEENRKPGWLSSVANFVSTSFYW